MPTTNFSHQPLKPWDSDMDRKSPMESHPTFEAPTAEIFQMPNGSERSISDSMGTGTNTTQYRGVPAFDGSSFAHELEGSRPTPKRWMMYRAVVS